MPLPLIPIMFGVAAGGVIAELFDLGREFFGGDEPVAQPPRPPSAPPIPLGTNVPTEEQQNNENSSENEGLEEDAEKGGTTQEQADEVSAEGRSKLDQIIEQLNQVAGRNANPDGGPTPETEAANDQASRDALQQLRETLAGADAANRGLAGQLPGMGGMPGGMGMGGMNPLGGLGGLGGGGPMMGGGASPFSGLGESAPMTPADNPLAMDTGGAEPSLPVNPLADTGSEMPADPAASPLDPDNPLNPEQTGTEAATPESTDVPPQPEAAGTNEVTGPDGETITAPDATTAAVLRAAVDNPGATNQAASAYQTGAGVTLPADDADPGQLVSPTLVRPGDIARWDDPPQDLIVWGNGKVINSNGDLADLNEMLRSGVFNAFFRPNLSANSATTSPATPAQAVDPLATPPDSAVP
ncbi:hypothetical protein FIV07_27750 (plasmid) [Mycobacterium sp. THAF192]|nr:hypothetical protein FIV07_27750 [Mycobacterium sp. THAF192]